MRKKKYPGSQAAPAVIMWRNSEQKTLTHDVFVTFHNWVVVITVTGNLDLKKSLRRLDVSPEAAVNLLARRDNHWWWLCDVT